jgi:hypothetical protein
VEISHHFKQYSFIGLGPQWKNIVLLRIAMAESLEFAGISFHRILPKFKVIHNDSKNQGFPRFSIKNKTIF